MSPPVVHYTDIRTVHINTYRNKTIICLQNNCPNVYNVRVQSIYRRAPRRVEKRATRFIFEITPIRMRKNLQILGFGVSYNFSEDKRRIIFLLARLTRAELHGNGITTNVRWSNFTVLVSSFYYWIPRFQPGGLNKFVAPINFKYVCPNSVTTVNFGHPMVGLIPLVDM